MHNADLAPLLSLRWTELSPRIARDRVEGLGWKMCGQGDWAYAYRSPSGQLVARVSPFEPVYGYFVELCRRCAGNRHVPSLELATRLEGGGHLAVLEHLAVPARNSVETFLGDWERPARSDPDLRALRREVDAIDERGRRTVPWWTGIDLGERHVLLSTDGNLKVIDLFSVGWSLLDDLLRDPQAFASRVPPDRCRYLLDIPDLQLNDHPADYLPRLRAALAVMTS
ncbi:hypothetical protein [Tenggerimyces flavus]|uniref:Uncharacterized protein n=1 Tax=Tenggerimyces flavus TaxID=1708749 RepID=A0ABV7YDI2_9ACTN|nr:hypothetical protein [Tenggerimyces flavus]MBM7783685.1 hypothetical protein [Tenggerimyces flavus]